MDDYEVPDAVVKALRALSNKEEPPCKVNTTAPNADAAVTMAAPAATLAEETSTTQADANSCPPAPCSPADTSGAMSNPVRCRAACSAAEFDYSGLDAQTVTDLHLAERECAAGRRLAEAGLRRMADGVAIAHEALVPNWDNSKHGNRGEDAFRRWCESIGVSKSAAYRLLQVTALFDNSSPEQQKILDSLSPSLLYAAAKPTAPADLVQAVKSGDITTHKQYQDLLKENQQLRADRVNALNAAAAAEAARDAALADVDGLHKQNRQLQAAATGAQESYRAPPTKTKIPPCAAPPKPNSGQRKRKSSWPVPARLPMPPGCVPTNTSGKPKPPKRSRWPPLWTRMRSTAVPTPWPMN